MPDRSICLQALGHYSTVAGVDLGPLLAAPPGDLISPLGDGLINETYLVELGSARAVLQRVSPIFGRAVHDDIEAITAHLQARGLVTPRLHRTTDGQLSVDLGSVGIWRLMTYIPGQSHSVMTAALARPAGELVGRFHAALSDLRHDFRFVRSGAHDLAGHLRRLGDSVAAAERPDFHPPESPVPTDFFELARALLRHGETVALDIDPALPLRVCHGDLKLNNLRYDDEGQGVCLLDLDTLGRLPLCLELGDALRSWCNPRGEDAPDACFDLELFELALSGYAETARGFLLPVERDSLVAGVERISFQLAVRFAVDVVQQSYFRFSPQRFPSRAAHNLARAVGQWTLCRSVIAARPRAAAAVARVFKS